MLEKINIVLQQYFKGKQKEATYNKTTFVSICKCHGVVRCWLQPGMNHLEVRRESQGSVQHCQYFLSMVYILK